MSRVPTRLVLTEHNIISIVTTDAPMFRTRMTPFFVRRFYPWANDLVAVSQGAAEDLALTMGISADRIHVIYNPIVDPEFWKRAAAPFVDTSFATDTRPVILAVGRLHYHKDYPTLLRAFAIVRRSMDARLVFLGDGEERVSLSSLAHQLDIDSAVSFLGDVPNPLPYMKRAAILALSSVVEALPTVLIEALAMGLPIVATDCPTGPREILRNGAYGTLVPVGDSVALADAVLHVFQSPTRTAIPEEALARFRYDHIVSKYLTLLGISNSTEMNAACRTGEATFEK
jgi:glycosyltransferase involved in cell wall biosynthesis